MKRCKTVNNSIVSYSVSIAYFADMKESAASIKVFRGHKIIARYDIDPFIALGLLKEYDAKAKRSQLFEPLTIARADIELEDYNYALNYITFEEDPTVKGNLLERL